MFPKNKTDLARLYETELILIYYDARQMNIWDKNILADDKRLK